MGYKGFDKDFKCRGKQYMENTVFEEKGGNICGEGMMHYCDSPFDVLDYYPLIDDNGYINTFAMVEPLSEIKKEGNKRATSKLKIGAKLEIKGFVKACIDFLIEKTKLESTYSGDSAQMASSGDSAKMASSGDYAVIMCAGINSIAKAKIGSWITLAEWEYSEEKERYIPVCVKTEQVDGNSIKEDTFYKLVKGKFEEVK